MRSLPFEVDCPKCGARLVVSEEEWIDHPVSCPDCGEVFMAVMEPNSSDVSTNGPQSPSAFELSTVIDGDELPNSDRLPPIIPMTPDKTRFVETDENGSAFVGPTDEVGDGKKNGGSDEDDNEGDAESFDYRPFILVELGFIALILLATIFVLTRSPRTLPVTDGEVPVTEVETGDTQAETLTPPQGEPTDTDTADEPIMGIEMDLSQAETEFFKPSKLNEDSTDGTFAGETNESVASGEVTADAAELIDVEESAESPSVTSAESPSVTSDERPSETTKEESFEADKTESTDGAGETSPPPVSVKEESPKTTSSSAPENDSAANNMETAEARGEFETFSGRSPDSFTQALPVIKGAEAVDIPKRLTLGGKRIQLPETTLPQIIEILSQFSGIPIGLDVDSLPAPVAILEKPVAITTADWTVDKILSQLEMEFDLERVTTSDGITLTLPQKEKETKIKTVFDVTDIIAASEGRSKEEKSKNGEKGEISSTDSPVKEKDGVSILPTTLTPEILTKFLADFLHDDLVMATSAPDAVTKFLTCKTEEDGTKIFLEAPAKIVDQADSLLEQVRNIRHIPPKTKKMAEDLIPETLGWENLSRPCSLHFFQPVTLREALAVLETSHGIHFLYDRSAMKKAGSGLDSQVRLVADDLPLELILSDLLANLDLTEVILTENLLLVTSREEAAHKMTNEIHLWGDPQSSISEEDFYHLIHQIRTEIDPSSWRKTESTDAVESANSDNGKNADRVRGDDVGKGIIWFDSVSKSLLIRQNQPNQRAIRRFWAKTAILPSVPPVERPSEMSSEPERGDGDPGTME